MNDTKQAKRFFVSGVVQGVGFRYFTQHTAQHLRLSGYVRNLPDGALEVYAIGAEEHLAKLRSALERGPSGASVDQVREETAAMDAQYAHAFSITY